MRRTLLLLCSFLLTASSVFATSGHIIKVLPHFVDLEGRHALSPSLYDRDAYQAFLRGHTNSVSGVRFDVQWRARGRSVEGLKLRVELRGPAKGHLPQAKSLESTVKAGGWFNHWTALPLAGDDYRQFGEVTAWRVTLWDGDRLLSEQKSFLW
jgi:hypothetical protein